MRVHRPLIPPERWLSPQGGLLLHDAKTTARPPGPPAEKMPASQIQLQLPVFHLWCARRAWRPLEEMIPAGRRIRVASAVVCSDTRRTRQRCPGTLAAVNAAIVRLRVSRI